MEVDDGLVEVTKLEVCDVLGHVCDCLCIHSREARTQAELDRHCLECWPQAWLSRVLAVDSCELFPVWEDEAE